MKKSDRKRELRESAEDSKQTLSLYQKSIEGRGRVREKNEKRDLGLLIYSVLAERGNVSDPNPPKDRDKFA